MPVGLPAATKTGSLARCATIKKGINMSKFAVFLITAFLCSGALQAEEHEGGMHPPDPAKMFEKMDLNGDGTTV